VLADEPKQTRRFLILGSASRELIKQSSESLAGRIQYLELTPFNLSECADLKRLWVRGGFPKSYLAEDLESSLEWRQAYVKTFLEQDIPALGISIPSQALRRFWTMLAHYHGGILNLSELGVSFGASHTTIRNYLDILCGTFMVRQLQPWWENIGKRQVKTPKIYLRDSGLFHLLLGIDNWDELESHPKLGASWEGFALEEIIRHNKAEPGECFFWRTHAGAELDLLLVRKGKRIGFEFKYSETVKLTKSMHISKEELGLDELWVIVPSGENVPIAPGIRMAGLETYLLS
jgi:predicted AAA+ superfamily ATPase